MYLAVSIREKRNQGFFAMVGGRTSKHVCAFGTSWRSRAAVVLIIKYGCYMIVYEKLPLKMGLFPGSSCFTVPIFVHIGLAESEWQTKTWFRDEIRSDWKLWPLHARSKIWIWRKKNAPMGLCTYSSCYIEPNLRIPSYSKPGYVGAKNKTLRVVGNLFFT